MCRIVRIGKINNVMECLGIFELCYVCCIGVCWLISGAIVAIICMELERKGWKTCILSTLLFLGSAGRRNQSPCGRNQVPGIKTRGK